MRQGRDRIVRVKWLWELDPDLVRPCRPDTLIICEVQGLSKGGRSVSIGVPHARYGMLVNDLQLLKRKDMGQKVEQYIGESYEGIQRFVIWLTGREHKANQPPVHESPSVITTPSGRSQWTPSIHKQ